MSVLVRADVVGGPQRTITVERDRLEQVARDAGDVGRLSAMEREITRRIEAEGLMLAAGESLKLKQALLTYRGALVEVELSVIGGEEAAPDDLLALLRRQCIWLRYPGQPIEWLTRVRSGAKSLNYDCFEWRAGRGFIPSLGADTNDPVDALRAAQAQVRRPRTEEALFLFQDLEFWEGRSLEPRADVRGAMQTLYDEVRIRPNIHLVLLMPHDDVPPELAGMFEVTRLTPPKRATPTLDRLGLDLTKEARAGKLRPMVGGGEQVDQIIRTLNVIAGQPNNVLLVGEAGVGKTKLAEELARRIAVGDVPPRLKERRIIKLRGNDLVADTAVAGSLEARVRDLIDEVRRNRDEIVLFIDEAHALFGQGGREAPIVQTFKEGWARGDLPTIAATTLREVSVLEADPAVESRFRRVTVPRPNADLVLEVLQDFGPELEQWHKLSIEPDVYQCTRDCADRYLGHEAPPRSALRLLSMAASAAELENRSTLRKPDIMNEVQAMTGIPAAEPGQEERDRLRMLERTLSKELHGQDAAIKQVAGLIRTRRLSPPRRLRPLVILAFGPSGTGKTQIARLVQQHVCDPTLPPILFPMEQTKDRFQVTTLLGAPPGYVGYQEGAALAEKIAGRPHSVVIFDEIEKAHPEVIEALLQVLETGAYVDPRGRRGDYRSAVIVCTSNLLEGGECAGLPPAQVRRLVREAFEQRGVGAAFVGRCQVLVPFAPLSREACEAIAVDRLAEIQNQLYEDRGIRVQIDPNCARRLVDERWDPTQNARPIVEAVVDLESGVVGELETGDVRGTLRLDWDANGPVVREERQAA